MAKFKCKNFINCSIADSGIELDFPEGLDNKCEECQSTLVPVGDSSASAGASITKRSSRAATFGVIFAVCLGLLGVGAWWYRKATAPTVLHAEPITEQKTVPTTKPAAEKVASTDAAPKEEVKKPAAVLARENEARKSCEDATNQQAANAETLCRRATAITLMNSGVMLAIAGKLDEAEKDYSAAREKDPEFPELYFNLAVLYARQGKKNEAIDSLKLADVKGFKQFDAISKEPALQSLKADPAYKLVLEALERKASGK